METNKPENPNAFPYGYGTDKYERSESGMTLRDYFAAKAMQSIISNPDLIRACNIVGRESGQTNSQALAETSYLFADAMLKERNKTL